MIDQSFFFLVCFWFTILTSNAWKGLAYDAQLFKYKNYTHIDRTPTGRVGQCQPFRLAKSVSPKWVPRCKQSVPMVFCPFNYLTTMFEKDIKGLLRWDSSPGVSITYHIQDYLMNVTNRALRQKCNLFFEVANHATYPYPPIEKLTLHQL